MSEEKQNNVLISIYIITHFITYPWVIMKMWNWFIVPLCHFEILTYGLSFCLSLTVGLFKNKQSYDAKERTESHFLGLLIAPFIALLIGYLIK